MNTELTQNKKTNRKTAGAVWPLLLLVPVLLFTIATPVQAAPQMPCQFYGNVTIGGQAAAAGVSVTAYLNGMPCAGAVTDDSGRYGYDPDFFRVPADDPGTAEVEGGVNGQAVNFYINGAAAGTGTFDSGEVVNVNLSITQSQGNPPSVTPPAAPGGFFAAASAYGEVTLAWNDNSNNEQGFRISRSNDGAGYYAVDVPADTTSYTDSTVEPDTLYYYMVSAFNDAGDSILVGPVPVTSLPEPAARSFVPEPEPTAEPGEVPVITVTPVVDTPAPETESVPENTTELVTEPATVPENAPETAAEIAQTTAVVPEQETATEIKPEPGNELIPDAGSVLDGETVSTPSAITAAPESAAETPALTIFGIQLPDLNYPAIGLTATGIIAIAVLTFIGIKQYRH